MTKQEKIAVKNSLMSIKDSLFSDAWDEIVSDHPYVLQENDDIEDDFIEQEDNPQEDNAVSRGKMKMAIRCENIGSNIDDYCYNISTVWNNVTIAPIFGVAQGEEEGLGFYLNNGQVFVRQYSATDMALVLAHDKDEQEYLKSLGYVNISELFDKQNNTNN
jgi:hypothetical protein